MRYYCFLLFFVLGNFTGFSQTKALKIGDQVPDLEFNYLINYQGGKAKLSDFKGKLVILDFWCLGCVPCVKGFPKMERLQKEFDGKIQVILINTLDNKPALERWGFPNNTKFKYVNETKLPSSILNRGTPIEKLFSYGSLPFHVWIDENRKVVAMCDGISTTSERIKHFLNYGEIKIRFAPDLEDIGLDYEAGTSTQSIFQLKNKLVADNLLYSSIITKNIDTKGIMSRLFDSASGKMIGVRMAGSIPTLIRETFVDANIYNAPLDYIDLKVDNPAAYFPPSTKYTEERAKWQEENIYAYEVKFPAERMDTNNYRNFKFIYSIMRQDLERYFGIEVKIEKKPVECRILIRTSEKDKLTTKELKESFISLPDDEGIIMSNAQFLSLPGTLRMVLTRGNTIKPFLNETKISPDKRIDIEIKGPLDDIKFLKKKLNECGLDIVEGVRELEVMVIKKKTFN